MDIKLMVMLIGLGLASNALALTDPTAPVRLEDNGHVTIISDGTQMVLVSQDRQLAFVDGSYVSVGDRTKLGEVVGITDQGVEVIDFRKGKISILTVTGDTIKIKAKVNE